MIAKVLKLGLEGLVLKDVNVSNHCRTCPLPGRLAEPKLPVPRGTIDEARDCLQSKYEPGKRHWLKVKRDYLFDGAMADSADLVVLGAWYGTGNKGRYRLSIRRIGR